ncbi:MAG: NADH-quinone oxidoreductase subunit NuoE [Immundisolibacteraceae bacterium]|nr:NADH-quinone oxidoreductase subunit NuoE [Immundisolibacteraceae bacterium]
MSESVNSAGRSEQVLSDHVRQEMDHWLSKFPADKKKSAVIASLSAAQHENNGFLTVPLMDAVAEYLELAPIAVYEVATFYSMLETEPVGRHCIAICTNISCMLRGADELLAYVEHKIDTKLGESSADGKYFLKPEEECLAGCAGAPMMQVNHKYYENLDPIGEPAAIDQILESLD